MMIHKIIIHSKDFKFQLEMTIWRYQNMQVLMKLSKLILEKNKTQKHTKRQREKILKTLTLMKIEQKSVQQSGGQSMKL